MSIITRLLKIGEASINKGIDQLEKPELMLDQAIKDKSNHIRDAKKAIQECIATERETKALLGKEKVDKDSWEHKAEAALKAGKEDLAIKAIQRASEHEQKAKSLEENWQTQRKSVDSLKTDIHKMDDELAEFKRNKDFILAQSKVANVKKNIYEAKAKISKKHNGDDLMARMKAKAERSEYEAEAAKEMADSFTGKDSVEKEFEELGSTSASKEVQDKLEALKAKLGKTA